MRQLISTLLLVFVFLGLAKLACSDGYFNEVDRISHTRLLDAVDMSMLFDFQALIVTTGGVNSSIQGYELKFNAEPSFKLDPFMMIRNPYEPSTLKVVPDLTGIGFYTLSEEYRNNSNGCLLSDWWFKSSPLMFASVEDELFIKVPFNNKGWPHQKHLTSDGGLLILTCQSILAIVDINYDPSFKDSATLDDNFLSSGLVYDKSINTIYTSYTLLSESDETHAVAQAYTVSPTAQLESGKALLDNTKGYFYTKEVLIPSKLLWVYTYSDELFGSFITVQLHLKHSLMGASTKTNLKISSLVPSEKGDRLFYSSKPNNYSSGYHLGAFRVEDKGRLVPIKESLVEVDGSFSKMILLNDSCHIIGMMENQNNSQNGTLVIYRINDPAIGCTTDSSKLPLILSVSATAILLTVTGLVTAGICYWLKKQGAKKGYMPIGGD